MDDSSIRAHDLIQLKSFDAVDGILTAPDWVKPSLMDAPFVVVRRAPRIAGKIPVGVRGEKREMRWATDLSLEQIARLIHPAQLNSSMARDGRLQVIPAISALLRIESLWKNLTYQWGPAGSVGFELASGFPSAHKDSDLDLILIAESPLAYEIADSLLSDLDGLECSSELFVETGTCAFKLKEFCATRGGKILLKRDKGPELGDNPWALS